MSAADFWLKHLIRISPCVILSAVLISAAPPANPLERQSSSIPELTPAQTNAWFAERGQKLHEHELEWILWLQQTKAFAWPMRIITNLGPSIYVIVFLPFAFFCIDRRFGALLALVYFASSGIRETLAMTFCFPRPYWIDLRVDTFHYGRGSTLSYSLPSGHAMVGTSIWLFAASRFGKPWAWGAGLMIAIMICFSRVYLGVHFPSDVTAGFIAGTIFVLAFLRWETPLAQWWQTSSLGSQCATAAALGGVLLSSGILAENVNSAMPDPPSWAAFAAKAREFSRVSEQAGAVLGLGMGLALGRRWAPFEVHASWFRRLVSWALGCACLGALYLSRKIGPADSEVLRATVRFAGAFLSTWLMTCVVPWLCLRWKLVRPAVAC